MFKHHFSIHSKLCTRHRNQRKAKNLSPPKTRLSSESSALGDVVVGGPGLEVGASVLETTLETKLGLDAVHAVGRVDVLDEGDLEAGGGTLARGNGGVGQEEFPDLIN